jgi:XRE family transcriptional regulator, regulator of sulfur utilization
VAECRDARGFSQEDLAGKTELNRKFISSIENGHQAPGYIPIIKIAVVTQVSVGEMLGRTERLAASAGIVEVFAENGAGKTSQGMTTCPTCDAQYERYECKARAQKPGKFKCRFCKQVLASWRAAEPVLLFEARRLPAKLRRAK